jgi:molecular chaperone DnaJ
MTQAALGSTIAFETLDGEEPLPIPPGTQGGHLIKLRGRGVPHVRGRGRGDLLVHVVVETPTRLSKAQEELLRRLAVERSEEIAPPDEGLMARLRSAFG